MKQKFQEQINGVAKKLKEENNILVVSHHDADGITACAIMVDALRKLGKDVDFMAIKQLDSININKVENFGRTVVFTDMGSGQMEMLMEHKEKIGNFYVIDHHPPAMEYDKQVNPHFFGYDGGLDVSGAGLAYFVAKALGHEEMAHLAIVGAVGDMQDSDGKLHSLNRIILEDGIRQGTVKVKHDLRLFGRQSRALAQMLMYASDPILPGLVGNETSCVSFVENLGIGLKRENGEWKSYVDLDIEERRKLTSAMYMLLLDNGTPEYIIQGMIGEVFTLSKEEKGTELRDAKEFATLLNSCGRQEVSEVGVRVCLGDRDEGWKNAKDALQQYRRRLREGIEFLSGMEKEEMDNLYYFDASGKIDENIIGVIAGMGYGARKFRPNKPVLALAEDKDNEDMLKISSRANRRLVRRGLHLGNAMNDCSSAVGGEGGGHDIAAGARIPKERRDEFLALVDKMIKKQLNK